MVQSVIEAFSGLSDEAVDVAAGALPPTVAARLRAVRQAARSGEAAVVEAMRGPVDEVESWLVMTRFARTLRRQVDDLGTAASALSAQAARLATLQAALEAGLVGSGPDGERLASLLARLRGLPDEAQLLLGDVGAVIADLAGVADALVEDGPPAPFAPDRLALDRLATQLDAPRRSLVELLPVIEELASFADDVGRPGAASLRLVCASLTRDLSGAEAALPKWRAVLDAAARTGELRPAQVAAQQLQLDALGRRDVAGARDVAARVEAIASAVGDLRVRTLASLEQAVFEARLGLGVPAVARATAAVEASVSEPALHARSWLTLGQVQAQLGAATEARAAFRRALACGKDRQDCGREIAHAALGLGELSGHQPHQQGQLLDLALQLALALGEAGLVGRAAVAVGSGADVARAVEALRRVRVAAARGLMIDEDGVVDALAAKIGRAEARSRWAAAAP